MMDCNLEIKPIEPFLPQVPFNPDVYHRNKNQARILENFNLFPFFPEAKKMYTLKIFCKGKKCHKVFSFLNSLRNFQEPMLERILMNISHIGKASATYLLSSMKILTLEQNLHVTSAGEILVFYKKHA